MIFKLYCALNMSELKANTEQLSGSFYPQAIGFINENNQELSIEKC